MTPLTKEQVQQSAILVVESMQGGINSLNESLAAAEKENERLEARIVDLLEEIVELKQRIARLESGRAQTVYPWKAE